MKDPREQFIEACKSSLYNQGYDVEDIRQIITTMILNLENYEVTNRITEIAVIDTSTDQLLKLYAGKLITEGKSQKSVYAYIRVLKRFADEIRIPLLEVKTMDVMIWLAKMQSNVSLRTCENYRSYLSAFYQWLNKEEIIEKNPMSKINPIKCEEKVKFPFTDVEVDKIRSKCMTLRERAEVELFIASGARVSELCSMNIDDIDLITHDVIIRKGKGGKQRKTYMTDVCAFHLKKYLESRSDNEEALFLSKYGKRIGKNSVEEDMRRIGERAGIDHVHPHRFRRHFCTNYVKKGGDLRTAQILMGHSDINTTTTYLTMSDQHIKNEYMRFV